MRSLFPNKTMHDTFFTLPNRHFYSQTPASLHHIHWGRFCRLNWTGQPIDFLFRKDSQMWNERRGSHKKKPKNAVSTFNVTCTHNTHISTQLWSSIIYLPYYIQKRYISTLIYRYNIIKRKKILNLDLSILYWTNRSFITHYPDPEIAI